MVSISLLRLESKGFLIHLMLVMINLRFQKMDFLLGLILGVLIHINLENPLLRNLELD